jgi:hypothetical protein
MRNRERYGVIHPGMALRNILGREVGVLDKYTWWSLSWGKGSLLLGERVLLEFC